MRFGERHKRLDESIMDDDLVSSSNTEIHVSNSTKLQANICILCEISPFFCRISILWPVQRILLSHLLVIISAEIPFSANHLSRIPT